MIIVSITMTVRPEKRKEVMQTLLSMIEPTLQEKGCLSYQVFQDIDRVLVGIIPFRPFRVKV
jgi:quinol monooxygenase YgiN